jgi:hypothetical protein
MQQQFNSAKFEDMSHHTTHKQVILSDKKKGKRKHKYRSGESHHNTSREINSQSPRTQAKD